MPSQVFKSGFFNSNNGDRVYDAEDFNRMFDGIIEDGIIRNYKNGLMPSAVSGVQNVVMIRSGKAWFNNSWILLDNTTNISLSSPEIGRSRVDAVVIDINHSTRSNTIIAVSGTPYSSGSPSEHYPTMINDSANGHYQYAICYVLRENGVNVIPASAITDVRGTNVTGAAPYSGAIGLIVDNTMSNTSANAVQNQVIKNYIDGGNMFKCVWENSVPPSTGSVFPAQTISNLQSAGYTHFVLETTNNSWWFFKNGGETNSRVRTLFYNGPNLYEKIVKSNTGGTSVTFEDTTCYNIITGESTVANDYLYPYRLYAVNMPSR